MTNQAIDLGKGLKDLNLTNEELNKFEKAFKDPEFLKLFEEYAKEVSDPKVKAETDLYLRQLEEQGRAEEVYGKGVQLVVPAAALVIKSKVLAKADTSASASAGENGAPACLPVGQKVFINVCTSDKVGRYSLQEAKDPSGRVGKTLSIPLTLGPVRKGTDKHGQPASVYDFVVHPESVDFANGNPVAFNSLAETALEHVERVSHSKLSRGWRRLNIKYKATEGCTEPPVQSIRTAEGGEAVGGRLRPRADVPGVDVPGARSAPSAPPAAEAATEGAGKGAGSRSTFSFDRPKAPKAKSSIMDPAQPGYRHADGCVTPEWSLVHRGEAELTEAWKDAGRGLAIMPSVPKELVVRVTLPDVSSASAVDLDVGQRVLTLKVPGRYALSVPLPFAVDEAKGRAKLDKARKCLEVSLPVVPPPPPPRPSAAQPLAPSEEEAAGDEQPATAATVQEALEKTAAAAVHGSDPGQGTPGAPAASQGAESSSDGARGGAGQDAAAEAETTAREEGPEDGVEAAAGGPRAGGGEGYTAASPSGTAEAAGSSDAEGQRQLTENERRWLEIHARAHPDAVVGPSQSGATESVSHAGSSGQPEDGPVTGQACEAAAAQHGQPPGPAAAEAAAPTVLLRPRLQCGLAMELD